jgi:hypothetical protein
VKTPAEYIEAAWQPEPEPWPAGGIPFVPLAQAEAAVAAALADAEKYRGFLLRALRRGTSSTLTADVATQHNV